MDNLWSSVNAIMLYPYDINKYNLMFMLVKISLALKARDKNVDKNERKSIIANSTCHSLRYTYLKILIGCVALKENWFLFAIIVFL